MGLKGVPNSRVFEHSERVSIDGVELNIIALSDLLTAKRRSGRLRDQADADELERLNR